MMNRFGTIGPYDCEGDQVEMDWVWSDHYQEASITEMRFNGIKVEPFNVAEWIVEALFQEVPYDELMGS